MSTKRPILVTGSNRSGSTWVGKVIATHPKVDTIIEPLNINRIKRFQKFDIDYWYLKIDDSTDTYIRSQAYALISYYLNISFTNIVRNPLSVYEGHSGISALKKRLRRAAAPIKLLKDPTALFCVPWLVEEFHVRPVLLIRHPAAYVLSIKEKKWWFNFDNFLLQPGFFDGELAHLKEEVIHFKKREPTATIIENAALLWKIFYTQVASYKNRYPEWFFTTHEELSITPIKTYENLFGYLELTYSDSIQEYIEETTNARNITQYERNSEANTQKWRDRLSSAEKEIIYNIVGDVSNMFYEKFI